MPKQDLAWEAIVKATRANPAFERGRIATALSAIRECCQLDGIPEEDVPGEIELRAQYYREKWPHLDITPTALARHWYRVLPEKKESALDRWEEKFGEPS